MLAEPAPGISASPCEENARHFNVMIIGPTTSPYEGGVYKLELFLPEDYPMAAPKVRRGPSTPTTFPSPLPLLADTQLSLSLCVSCALRFAF